jgi:hypothetical protein
VGKGVSTSIFCVTGLGLTCLSSRVEKHTAHVCSRHGPSNFGDVRPHSVLIGTDFGLDSDCDG